MNAKLAVALAGVAIAGALLFLVGRNQTWWSADDVERTGEQRETPPLRTEASDGSTATLQGSGAEENLERSREPAPPTRRLTAHQGTIRFHFQQGWSFEKQLVHSGFELDLAIAEARDEEFQAEIERARAIRERPIRERLADLDGRAARLHQVVRARGDEEHRVAGVLTRTHARELSHAKAYPASTFSFEHDTRDDVKTTRNDWDFVLEEYDGATWLDIGTVTDDRGRIRDLGPLDFETALRGAFPAGEGVERVRVVAGHLYLVHTLDSESDYWVLFRVLEVTPAEDMIFEWVRVEDPDPLRHAFGAGEKELQRGYARLQVRSDHGGGNPHRAFLDGTKNAYVDELATAPLELAKPDGSPIRRSRAYVDGGLVPLKMVFLVESADVTIDIDGDNRPRVDSLVRVGPYPVLWIEDGPHSGEEPSWLLFTAAGGIERLTREQLHVRRRIAVRIPLRRDDEKFVFVEGASFTRNDVVLEGRLLAEADAPKAPARPESLHNRQYVLKQLLLTEDAEAAVAGLRRSVGLTAWLRGLRSMAVSSDYRARLGLAIEYLEETVPTPPSRDGK